MATVYTDTGSEEQTTSRAETARPLADLVRQLRDDVTFLFRQEIALAKTETSEKVSRLTRNGVYLAVGGLIAYAGFIVLLLAGTVGLYIGLVAAGLTHATSGWLAPLIVGAIVALVGYGFVQKALSTIRNESMVPERSKHSLQTDKEWAKGKVTS